MNYRSFIKKIEKLCGEKKGYMVLFKDDYSEAALSRIYRVFGVSNVRPLVRVRRDGLEFNIFRTGKIIIKGVDKESDLWSILDDIYRDVD